MLRYFYRTLRWTLNIIINNKMNAEAKKWLSKKKLIFEKIKNLKVETVSKK